MGGDPLLGYRRGDLFSHIVSGSPYGEFHTHSTQTRALTSHDFALFPPTSTPNRAGNLTSLINDHQIIDSIRAQSLHAGPKPNCRLLEVHVRLLSLSSHISPLPRASCNVPCRVHFINSEASASLWTVLCLQVDGWPCLLVMTTRPVVAGGELLMEYGSFQSFWGEALKLTDDVHRAGRPRPCSYTAGPQPPAHARTEPPKPRAPAMKEQLDRLVAAAGHHHQFAGAAEARAAPGEMSGGEREGPAAAAAAQAADAASEQSDGGSEAAGAGASGVGEDEMDEVRKEEATTTTQRRGIPSAPLMPLNLALIVTAENPFWFPRTDALFPP